MKSIDLREAQIRAVTDEMREEGDDSNPIISAESAPNRYYTITYFFPEDDGVRIEEDLDPAGGEKYRVFYFDDEGEKEVTEGTLYEWAIKTYESA